MAQQTVSINIKDKVSQESAKSVLARIGWTEDLVKNPYVAWRMIGEEGIGMMYTSGKLVLQGEDVKKVERELVKSSSKDFEPHIGVDEVGKGDFFGPLVVCAAYVSSEDSIRLMELGVTDSKSLSDTKIEDIGSSLTKTLLHKEIVLAPSEFNDKYGEIGNISIMLAGLHAQAVASLYEEVGKKDLECGFVVFDQFSKNKGRLEKAMEPVKDLKIIQFHKGESDIAVAAGSVLARYYFLKYWADMELKYSFAFPKGASEVIDSGKEFVQEFGADELRNVAKISFKTSKQVLSLF